MPRLCQVKPCHLDHCGNCDPCVRISVSFPHVRQLSCDRMPQTTLTGLGRMEAMERMHAALRRWSAGRDVLAASWQTRLQTGKLSGPSPGQRHRLRNISSPRLHVWPFGTRSRDSLKQVAVSWMRAVQAAGQGKEAEPPLSPICDHLPLQAWVEPCNTEPCPEGECGSRRSRVAEVTHIQRSALDPQRICVDGLWADWRDWEAQRPSSLGIHVSCRSS